MIRRTIEVRNAGFANRIIANSIYSTESILRAYGLVSTPIYCGIDKLEFFPDSKLKKNQVLVIGNHEPQKALPFVIEVISRIDKNTRPNLVIVSPRDTDSTELRKIARKLKVELELRVGIPQAELRKIYSQSKITLALAYLEPFGLSVIESLACGVPVVAVKEGGFKETVIHEKTGLLIERNSTKIAEAVQTLLLDKKKLAAMGEAGVKVTTSDFSWDQTVKQFENIFYESIVKRG
jgi:glycosyltransferase involved in cell wall biosynthesis